MKIERTGGSEPTFKKVSLVYGEVYKEVGGDDEDIFIVTDEGAGVYLNSGTEYKLDDIDGEEFVRLTVKVVIE